MVEKNTPAPHMAKIVRNRFLFFYAEKKLYCIYVAIGQKRSTVAQLVKRLTDAGKYFFHNVFQFYSWFKNFSLCSCLFYDNV